MKIVTTDGAIHRRVTPSANMGWLGDAPTADRSARYEQMRASRHFAALSFDRAELLRLERELVGMFCESDASRQQRNARLVEVQRQLSAHCQCEICNT